jgi:hypothetical protein
MDFLLFSFDLLDGYRDSVAIKLCPLSRYAAKTAMHCRRFAGELQVSR